MAKLTILRRRQNIQEFKKINMSDLKLHGTMNRARALPTNQSVMITTTCNGNGGSKYDHFSHIPTEAQWDAERCSNEK